MAIRMQVTCIIIAAAVVWASFLYFSGQRLSLSMLSPFGISVAVVTTAALVFMKSLWRWRLWQGWLITRPYLAGTWKSELISTYKDKQGNATRKTVYVVISQSLTKLSLRMYTDVAHSFSLTDSIEPHGDDMFRMAVAYESIPNIQFRGNNSEIHYGAALFNHISYFSTKIEGHYWTDRKTSGSLTLHERRKTLASSFEGAEILFQQADPTGWVQKARIAACRFLQC